MARFLLKRGDCGSWKVFDVLKQADFVSGLTREEAEESILQNESKWEEEKLSHCNAKYRNFLYALEFWKGSRWEIHESETISAEFKKVREKCDELRKAEPEQKFRVAIYTFNQDSY